MGKLAEIYDISKWGENGLPIWNTEITAEPGQPTANPNIYWKPIGRQFCPVIATGPVLLVFCDNKNKKPNWKFAGFLNIFVKTAIDPNYNTFISGRKIYLSEFQIIQLPQASEEFALAVDVAYWHNNFKIQCWDYRGIITTEELTEIARVRGTQLTIIERLQQINHQINLIDQNTNY